MMMMSLVDVCQCSCFTSISGQSAVVDRIWCLKYVKVRLHCLAISPKLAISMLSHMLVSSF